MTKSIVKDAKAEVKAAKRAARPNFPLDGVFGVFLLFVAISVGYANYMVYFGTDDYLSKFMLIPSSLAVLMFGIYKALK